MKPLEQFVPLHSKELEETIIGIMITSPNYLPLAFSSLFPECFYTDLPKRCFEAVKGLYDSMNTVDVVTVLGFMKKQGTIKETDPFELGKILTRTTPTGFHTHIKMLLEYYMKRKVCVIGQDFIQKGTEETTDPFDLINTASSELIKVQENVSRGEEKTIRDAVDKVFEDMQKAKDTGSIGLKTGFKDIDRAIMGWIAPDLVIIAARPGMGKTAMILKSIYVKAVLEGIPVAVFSLEMSDTQLVNRLLSIATGISHEKIRTGDLTENEMDLLFEARELIAKAPIYIDDRANLNVNEIRTRSIIWKRKYGIEAIFIDYLQIMSGVNEKNKNRETVISEISRGCKQLAKELEIPVIALSQLSRAVESRADKMPQLSDLRESGAIEQDADVVIFLMRPDYYGVLNVNIEGESVDANGLIIAIVAKNRHGSTRKIKMRFIPYTMEYKDFTQEYSGSLPSNFIPLPPQNGQAGLFVEPGVSPPGSYTDDNEIPF